MTVEKVSGAGDFLYRRFTRLYPTFWICLLITFGLVAWLGLPGREVNTEVALWNLTMAHELWGWQHVDGVYWSLLPELLFYALMTVLLLLRLHKSIWLLSGVWCILIWLQLQYGWFSSGWEKVLNLKYGMLFVAGIHFYHLFKGRTHGLHHFFILISFWLCCRIYTNHTDQLWILSFYGIFYLTVYGHMGWIKLKPLLWLGQISYAFYLLHQNIGYIMLNKLKASWGGTEWWMVLLPFAAVLLLAHFVTFYLERPLLKWLRALVRKAD